MALVYFFFKLGRTGKLHNNVTATPRLFFSEGKRELQIYGLFFSLAKRELQYSASSFLYDVVDVFLLVVGCLLQVVGRLLQVVGCLLRDVGRILQVVGRILRDVGRFPPDDGGKVLRHDLADESLREFGCQFRPQLRRRKNIFSTCPGFGT
jgi:hypothetical protein